MKKFFASPVSLIAAHITALILNFGYSVSGNISPLKWLNFIVTILYLLCLFMFIKNSKSPKPAVVMYSVILIASVLIIVFPAPYSETLWIETMITIIGVLLYCPFAGLQVSLTPLIFKIAVLIISATAITMSVIKIKKRKIRTG